MSKIRTLNKDNLQYITKGANGEIYRINDEQILKLYFYNTTLDDILQQRIIAKEMLVQGLPVMIPFETVKVGSRYGIIFELLNGDSVANIVMENPDKIEYYGRKMGKLMKILHNTKVGSQSIPSYADNIDSWINIMSEKFNLSKKNANALRKFKESIPISDTLIHRDFHEGNIMVQNGELIMIDLDGACMGNPIFEFVFHYLNHNMLVSRPDMLMRSTGLTPEISLTMRKYQLFEYFGKDDEKWIKKFNKRLLPFVLFQLSTVNAWSNNIEDYDKNKIIHYIKTKLPTFFRLYLRMNSLGKKSVYQKFIDLF